MAIKLKVTISNQLNNCSCTNIPNNAPQRPWRLPSVHVRTSLTSLLKDPDDCPVQLNKSATFESTTSRPLWWVLDRES